MCAYKGKICLKQYIKDKHSRFGIKSFCKASANTGYCYKIIPYNGKNFKYNKNIGIGASIIIEMTKDHESKGFHFTFDIYYSNMNSISYLVKNNIFFTFTFSRNRKAIPEEIKKVSLGKDDIRIYNIKNTEVLMMLIKDKKEVNIASNYFGYKTVKYKNKKGKYKRKREMIAIYNITKGGVDLLDCNCNIHPT